ncbi:hypothetical protein LRS06_19420 [Hymenobacter sp. J193]|uniref:hypothetical protein n=1 Tax=Hymenobacter sp. J193 TaxID=2898429 RepID=UPI002151B4C4|nr:hypothetical protein [Hymenobacter sp. J193]MCR5889902.1 hypothetical protein [Hymenobacter sp. J193]
MFYFLVFALVCLGLAVLPEGTWTRSVSLLIVGIFYALVLLCARTSRLDAWQQKEIVGSEELPSSLASMDPSTYEPIYRGEDTWAWMLWFLPLLALICWYYINRSRNALLRSSLMWLYGPYTFLVIYGLANNLFPGPESKPEFMDEQLKIPI